MPTPNFFSEYIELNTGTEIPRIFTYWCSLSAVSCVLGRRIWIDMGTFRIYPNMYIILIAGSGQMRKSTAIGVTRDLLEALSPSPNMISQKVTPESLIDAMKVKGALCDPTKIQTGNGEQQGQGFLVTDELTNFLTRTGVDNGISGLLIEFYDCRRKFVYRTKSRGEEVLVDTQLGLLAGTTPEELRKAIPEEVIGSGLASRILFVYESTPADPVSFPCYSPRQREAKEFCIRSLGRSSALSGEVKLSKEVKAWANERYEKEYYNSKLLEDPHLRGYASRRYVHLFKIALNFMVGLTESMELTPAIMKRAEAMLLANETHLQKVIQLVTMNNKGGVINQVLSFIAKQGAVDRVSLVRAFSHRLDSRELVEVIDTLKQSGQLDIQVHGSKIMYIHLKDKEK